MENSSAQTPLVPPSDSPRSASTHRLSWIVGFGLALVLIGIVIAGVWWWHSSRSPLAGFPPELRAAVLLTPHANGVAYSVGKNGFVTLDSGGKVVREATRGAKHVVFLLEDATSYAVTVDGETIATSSLPMQHISLSPDGTKLAVARESKGSVAATTTDWHVFVYTIATKKATDIGAGFSPVFLGDAHIMYFVPYGIRMHDLGNASDYIALLYPFKDNPVETLASPDRKMIGWSIGDGPVGLFAVTHVAPVALHYEGTGSTTPNTRYTLGNGVLYEVRQDNGVSEVWKRSAVNQEPVKIYTFPKGMTIEKITF